MLKRRVLGGQKPVFAELLEIFEAYVWVSRADRFPGECDITFQYHSSSIWLQPETLNDFRGARSSL